MGTKWGVQPWHRHVTVTVTVTVNVTDDLLKYQSATVVPAQYPWAGLWTGWLNPVWILEVTIWYLIDHPWPWPWPWPSGTLLYLINYPWPWPWPCSSLTYSSGSLAVTVTLVEPPRRLVRPAYCWLDHWVTESGLIYIASTNTYFNKTHKHNTVKIYCWSR